MRGEIGRIISIDERNEAIGRTFMHIVIGCANKAKKYSLMSKITISDIYSKTYGQWKQKNSNCWIEKCSNNLLA